MGIGDIIGSATQSVNDSVADPAKEKIKELQDWLPSRPDLVDEDPKFIQGVDLSTPDGSDPTVPAAGAQDPEDPSSNVALGLQIEFIHFGRVNHDVSDFFAGTEAVDDTKALDDDKKLDGGRAVYFRAAVQREAMFLGGLAKAISTAMEERAAEESGVGELVTMAADLLGGQGGTKTEPSPADMMQFLDKVAAAYNQVNKEDIAYADLHDAGIQLQTIRATFIKYLTDLVPKKPDPNADPNAAPASTPSPTGMLSNLPIVGGGLPIPGPIGDAITFMRTYTEKIFDVQSIMIYGLVLKMGDAIEQACRQITLDFINDERTPIYPIWSLPQDVFAPDGKFADLAAPDLGMGGAPMGVGDTAQNAANSGTNAANSALNQGAQEPMQVVDFLSKPYPAPPGGTYLDTAFQVTDESGIFGGSEKLAELAVACFYTGISTDPPDFLQGFVADFLSYIFAVDLEFLRGVYRTLCSMPTNEIVSTQEIVAAGSVHLVEHFIDVITSKLGLDDIIKSLSMPIPDNPMPMAGINWPTGTLSAEPIAAKLKEILAEKIGPYISPLTDYAMNGLAQHLNATRGWAKGGAFTMEAHLAALPVELAFLFRNTFGPLWNFITETLYGVVGDELKKVLGPAADAFGFADDALTAADSYISQAQNWATQAQSYANNVEQKAQGVMSSLSGVGMGQGANGIPTGPTGLDGVQNAVGALTGAAGTNPFSPLQDPFAPTPGELFPEDRVVTGKGTAIEQSDYDEVSANDKYDDADQEGSGTQTWAGPTDPNAADPNAADPNAAGSSSQGSQATSSASSSTGSTS